MKKHQTRPQSGSQFAAGRSRAARAHLRGQRRIVRQFEELRFAATCRALPETRVAIVRLDPTFSFSTWLAGRFARVVRVLRRLVKR